VKPTVPRPGYAKCCGVGRLNNLASPPRREQTGISPCGVGGRGVGFPTAGLDLQESRPVTMEPVVKEWMTSSLLLCFPLTAATISSQGSPLAFLRHHICRNLVCTSPSKFYINTHDNTKLQSSQHIHNPSHPSLAPPAPTSPRMADQKRLATLDVRKSSRSYRAMMKLTTEVVELYR
jgi:hypothetical protein